MVVFYRFLCLALLFPASVTALRHPHSDPRTGKKNCRTSPPQGSVVVRLNTTSPTEYPTVSAAVLALPNDTTSQSIFIYPGVYNEQVTVNRTGPLTIYGYSTNTLSSSSNTVSIVNSLAARDAGSNELSGTLRVRQNNFAIYNIDIKNTFGPGTQAVAFAQNGNRVGVYASRLYGYQDTLYANEGAQVYAKGYIEGAVDFIFGGVNRTPRAFFQGNTIAVSGPGYVTAHGRVVDDVGIYVFDNNTITLSSTALANTTGNVYLGRPWRNYAKVIFKSTRILFTLNPGIWSIWNTATPNTEHILFAEYDTRNASNTDPANGVRPDFVTFLTAEEAAIYDIARTLGEDWKEWVDEAYISV